MKKWCIRVVIFIIISSVLSVSDGNGINTVSTSSTAFTITQQSGMWYIAPATAFDYETTASTTVKITVTDSLRNQESSNIPVSIADVDETPSVLDWTLSVTRFNKILPPNDLAVLSNGTIYMACSKYDATSYYYAPVLYKSTNQGNSWTQVSTTGLTSFGYANSIAVSGNTMILTGRAVNTANGGEIYISNLH